MNARRAMKEGASAPSNLVRLPGAAKRKVRQEGGWKAQQAAADTLPQFPFAKVRYEASPRTLRRRELARLMLDSERSACLQLALAVYAVLDDKQRIRARARLTALGALNRAGARNASAWIEYEEADKWEKEQIDLEAAIVVREEY